MHWLFGTAVSEHELRSITPQLDRGLSDPPRLVYAGRLSEEKGVLLLVEMMALLKQRGVQPLPSLTVLGDGPLMGEMQRLRERYGCGDCIELPGYVDRTGLTERFLRADMSVQPSYTESMCKAWVDAMAHGLPVIATDVGSAQVTIGAGGERGWIAPVGDAAALTDVVERALRADVDWPALRRRCRSYAESRTLERWGAAIADRCSASWGCRLVEAHGVTWAARLQRRFSLPPWSQRGTAHAAELWGRS
ncbi:MAG: glycosyltransferase [Bryobacterales bacterium]